MKLAHLASDKYGGRRVGAPASVTVSFAKIRTRLLDLVRGPAGPSDSGGSATRVADAATVPLPYPRPEGGGKGRGWPWLNPLTDGQ